MHTLGPQTVVSDTRVAHRRILWQRESVKWSCDRPKQPYWFFSTIQNTRKHRLSEQHMMEKTGRNPLLMAQRRKRMDGGHISKPSVLLGCLFLSSKNWEAWIMLNCCYLKTQDDPFGNTELTAGSLGLPEIKPYNPLNVGTSSSKSKHISFFSVNMASLLPHPRPPSVILCKWHDCPNCIMNTLFTNTSLSLPQENIFLR